MLMTLTAAAPFLLGCRMLFMGYRPEKDHSSLQILGKLGDLLPVPAVLPAYFDPALQILGISDAKDAPGVSLEYGHGQVRTVLVAARLLTIDRQSFTRHAGLTCLPPAALHASNAQHSCTSQSAVIVMVGNLTRQIKVSTDRSINISSRTSLSSVDEARGCGCFTYFPPHFRVHDVLKNGYIQIQLLTSTISRGTFPSVLPCVPPLVFDLFNDFVR
ncbi:hypothetical protein C8R44DRAFT_896281 [Mycena epipterygia]|nr:hypothetical protein C8R44DRAFT_896281 [Mycena epipterygia]